jgi:nucleotide-binding universal stress UspA family protein
MNPDHGRRHLTRTRLAIRTIRDDAAIDRLEPDAGGAGQPPGEAKPGRWRTATSVARGQLAESGSALSAAGSIVVGIDGSATGRVALQWAVREASLLGVPLTLCHTHSVTGLAGTRRIPPRHSEDILEHAIATVSQHLDQSRITAFLGYGDPARVLAQVSADALLLSIGTHGYFVHAASLFEPLSMRIIAGAGCPVVVHPVLAGPSGPFAGCVVAGVDGSAASRAALRYAADHAAAHGLPLAAVHVSQPADPWSTSPILDDPLPGGRAADELLDAELSRSGVAGRGIEVRRGAYSGRAVPGLLRAAAGAELLAIGARGAGTTPGGSLGPVAQHMVGNATCTVAVIPAPAQD